VRITSRAGRSEVAKRYNDVSAWSAWAHTETPIGDVADAGVNDVDGQGAQPIENGSLCQR